MFSLKQLSRRSVFTIQVFKWDLKKKKYRMEKHFWIGFKETKKLCMAKELNMRHGCALLILELVTKASSNWKKAIEVQLWLLNRALFSQRRHFNRAYPAEIHGFNWTDKISRELIIDKLKMNILYFNISEQSTILYSCILYPL